MLDGIIHQYGSPPSRRHFPLNVALNIIVPVSLVQEPCLERYFSSSYLRGCDWRLHTDTLLGRKFFKKVFSLTRPNVSSRMWISAQFDTYAVEDLRSPLGNHRTSPTWYFHHTDISWFISMRMWRYRDTMSSARESSPRKQILVEISGHTTRKFAY